MLGEVRDADHFPESDLFFFGRDRPLAVR